MYALYGKRTGKKVWNQPVFDKKFAALDSQGLRVSRLDNAVKFETEQAAKDFFFKHKCHELVKQGVCEYEIRKLK